MISLRVSCINRRITKDTKEIFIFANNLVKNNVKVYELKPRVIPANEL